MFTLPSKEFIEIDSCLSRNINLDCNSSKGELGKHYRRSISISDDEFKIKNMIYMNDIFNKIKVIENEGEMLKVENECLKTSLEKKDEEISVLKNRLEVLESLVMKLIEKQ